MTGQQGSKHEINKCDCVPLNPLQTTQWCQIGASQLLATAGITEMKLTQSRGLIQLGICCLKPLLSIQLSLNLMHQPCAVSRNVPCFRKACGDCISALHSALAYSSHLTLFTLWLLSLLFLINRQYSLSLLTLGIWPVWNKGLLLPTLFFLPAYSHWPSLKICVSKM